MSLGSMRGNRSKSFSIWSDNTIPCSTLSSSVPHYQDQWYWFYPFYLAWQFHKLSNQILELICSFICPEAYVNMGSLRADWETFWYFTSGLIWAVKAFVLFFLLYIFLRVIVVMPHYSLHTSENGGHST